MSEWKEYTLSEVLHLIGGGTPKTSIPEYWDGDIPWLSVTDFNNGRKYCYSAEKSITDKGLKESSTQILKKGQVIISARGTVGVVSMLGKDMAFNQSSYGIDANPEYTCNDYLYYWLKNALSVFLTNSYGAVFNTITKSTFENISILLPPLPEQRAIASVLSSLDDKIDLLHRQNKTLEAIAETLFRQWFVEEAQEDWEEVKLGNHVKCTTGYSYKSADLNPSKNALVTLKNFARDGSFRMDGFKEYTGKYKDTQIVKQGNLVVSHTDITQEADIIGNPALVIDTGQFETLIITMDLMKVESNVDWLSKEFLYYLFKSPDFKFHCLGCSNGTTVLHMSRNAIPEYEFKIPNKEKVIAFTQNIEPSIEKKLKNISQIRTLEKLRDILLPKLMNGEVRVEYPEN